MFRLCKVQSLIDLTIRASCLINSGILLELGKKTGDKLPKELVSVGVFEDPDIGRWHCP
jgi:hypothetical protein